MLVQLTSLMFGLSAVTTQPVQISEQARRLLASHNRERALARVQPLQWDRHLEASAAVHAAFLAATGRLQHSVKNSRPGQAENLWMGTRAAYAPEQMVWNWAATHQKAIATDSEFHKSIGSFSLQSSPMR